MARGTIANCSKQCFNEHRVEAFQLDHPWVAKPHPKKLYRQNRTQKTAANTPKENIAKQNKEKKTPKPQNKLNKRLKKKKKPNTKFNNFTKPLVN